MGILQISICLLFLVPFTTSISFDYNTFYPNIGGITIEGDAFMGSDGVLQLTKNSIDNNLTYSVGRAAYIQPVKIWDPTTGNLTSFTTHFSFIINSIDPSNYGDGLAFFIAPIGSKIPPFSTGGYLGLFSPNTTSNSSSTFAVEFDTYPNSWDPKYGHVGIDVNSIVSVADNPFGISIGSVSNAWVSYDSIAKNLSVVVTVEGSSSHFGLNYMVDFKQVLPEFAIIGFSAATGTSVETHKILSWEFYSSLENF